MANNWVKVHPLFPNIDPLSSPLKRSIRSLPVLCRMRNHNMTWPSNFFFAVNTIRTIKIIRPLKEEYNCVGCSGMFRGAMDLGLVNVTAQQTSVGLP